MACSSHALGSWCVSVVKRRLFSILTICLLVTLQVNCFAKPIWQQNSAASSDKGSGDRSLRKDALTMIPWQSLEESDRSLVKYVVTKPTLYRRLPPRLVDCDAELYSHLLEHPELVVDVWGIMGISKLSVDKISPQNYRMTDSTGTVGKVRVLHFDGPVNAALSSTNSRLVSSQKESSQQGSSQQGSSQQGSVSRMLIHAEGTYEAPPMPRPIKANCILLLKSTATREQNGRTYIQTELDSFIRLDRAGAELLLKAMNPLVSRTADHNFIETMRFVSLFSRTAETNPAGMERLASHLTKVDESTRREFVTVCHEAAIRSTNRREQRVARTLSNLQNGSESVYR